MAVNFSWSATNRREGMMNRKVIAICAQSRAIVQKALIIKKEIQINIALTPFIFPVAHVLFA